MNEQPAVPGSGPPSSGTPESTPTPEVTPTPEASATPDVAGVPSSTPEVAPTSETAAPPEVSPTLVTSSAAESGPVAVASPAVASTSLPASSASTSRTPKWLPLFLAAVIPAVVVGLIVFALAGNNSGGSSGSSSGAGILDGFFRLGPASDGDVTSFKEKLPPDFPQNFPQMDGTKVVASFSIVSEDGTNYFVVLSGNHTPDEIYKYYLGALDKDPWQVEVARAADEFTGVRFSRPDDPDITGDVTVHHSDLDNQTVTYVSVEDASKKQAAAKKPADSFTLGASRDLPPGFPANDVPIYKGKTSTAVVTDTYIERGQGGQNFIVSALTKDSEDDVVKYYRDAFTKKGWTVKDGTPSSSASPAAQSIDFTDGSAGKISGSVRADQADADPQYTQVDLVLQVSGASPKGN